MKEVIRIPMSSLVPMFGEAADQSDFVKIRFPFPMRAAWDTGLLLTNFYGHKHIGEAIIESLEDILDYYGRDFLLVHDLDLWGGCYADRKTVTGKRKSVHAWGLAVDYLPHLGPYGKPSIIPYHIVMAFKKRGFIWGGDWSVPDGMHFSAVEE